MTLRELGRMLHESGQVGFETGHVLDARRPDGLAEGISHSLSAMLGPETEIRTGWQVAAFSPDQPLRWLLLSRHGGVVDVTAETDESFGRPCPVVTTRLFAASDVRAFQVQQLYRTRIPVPDEFKFAAVPYRVSLSFTLGAGAPIRIDGEGEDANRVLEFARDLTAASRARWDSGAAADACPAG